MRKDLFPYLIIISAILILIRLFYLQIIDDTLKLKSDNNAIRIIYDYPPRGKIYDRYGKLLVGNQISYDIMVTPNEVKNSDKKAFCKLLHISRPTFDSLMGIATLYNPRLRSVFLPPLNSIEYAALKEKLRKYEPGFEVVKRSLRDYKVKVGANVFGSISQANSTIIATNSYYKSGDLIGNQGVEQSYEIFLRGIKGLKYRQMNKFNKDIGSYKQGTLDRKPVRGQDIQLTIDIDLQKFGEELMVNKRGGIVALEPKTGEILALVTAPNYDPAILVGRQRSKNFTKLYNDSLAKPLYDRGLLAEYPPGSPFKIITGLIGLQEEVVNESTTFMCRNGFSYGRGSFMKCHGFGPHQFHNGIYNSCNTYFAKVFMKTINKYPDPALGVDAWSQHVKSFGLGSFLGYDLPTGKRGYIPTSQTYKEMYPNGGWRSATIVSNAIGQGEVLATPIQLANMISVVANEGFYFIPHIIKEIKGGRINEKFQIKHNSTIDNYYFTPMISGLFDVYNFGTASDLRVKGIAICGKTGTAENYAIIGGERVKMEDHSIFVAFAPKNNPKIAIAIFVENGGFGASVAGPIASLMIEKYLRGKITRTDLEKSVLEKSLKYQYDKYIDGRVDSASVFRRIPKGFPSLEDYFFPKKGSNKLFK